MTAHAPRIDAAELDAWWSGLVSLYREEADHASDPAIAARHLDEAARICADELDDPDRACSLYREAHDLAPRDPLAARALADLAERAADWPDVVRWLDAALDATAEGPARVGLQKQDLDAIDPAVEALNKAWEGAAQEMYAASQGDAAGAQPGADANAGDTSGSDNGSGDVSDVEYEEVK